MAKIKKTPVRATSVPKRGARKQPVRAKDKVSGLIKAVASKTLDVLRASDSNAIHNIRTYISTGSLELDRLLNGRGLPCGRIVELYGPPHLGKSTILDQCFASVQRMGGVGALVQTDVSRDNRYMTALGVDLDQLILLQPSETSLEHVGTSLKNLVKARVQEVKDGGEDYPMLIGWDALGLTATQEAIGKDYDEARSPGKAAKFVWDFMREMMPMIGGTNICFVLINHEYQKIQTFGRAGVKREAYGGQGGKFASTIRIGLSGPVEAIKRNDGAVIGRVVEARLDKNRLGDVMGSVQIAVIGGAGIDNAWSILRVLTQFGFIQKNGSWYTVNVDGEAVKFQGWQGLLERIRQDPNLYPRLVGAYQAAMSNAAPIPPPPTPYDGDDHASL